jgi:hypothetical protein
LHRAITHPAIRDGAWHSDWETMVGGWIAFVVAAICAVAWIGAAAAPPGRLGGFSGNRPIESGKIRHQEESDHEFFS